MTTIIRELKETVRNPHPDRRSKDWNKLPTVPKGMRFIDNDSSLRAVGRAYTFETTHTDLGKLIFANSTQVEPVSARELAEVHNGGWSAEYILETLVKLGRVGPEDFKAVAAADEAEDEQHKKENHQ